MGDGEVLPWEGTQRRGDTIDCLEHVEPLEDLVIGSNREARVAENISRVAIHNQVPFHHYSSTIP